MNREPLVIRTSIVALVTALVHLLILLKVIDLDKEAETAIITTVDLLVGLLIILLVRPKVTPVADPKLTVEQAEDLTIIGKTPDVVSSASITTYDTDDPHVGTVHPEFMTRDQLDRTPGPDHSKDETLPGPSHPDYDAKAHEERYP